MSDTTIEKESFGGCFFLTTAAIVLIYLVARGCTVEVVKPEGTTTYHLDMNEADD